MISVCFLFFKIPLPRGGSFPSIVIPTGAKHRVQSPLERWPRTISTDRPEMESRPYEFLLHPQSTQLAQPDTVHCDYPWEQSSGARPHPGDGQPPEQTGCLELGSSPAQKVAEPQGAKWDLRTRNLERAVHPVGRSGSLGEREMTSDPKCGFSIQPVSSSSASTASSVY